MYKAIIRYRLRIAALFLLIAAFVGSVFLIDILSGAGKSAFAMDNGGKDLGLDIKSKEHFTGDSNLYPGKPVTGIYNLSNAGNWTLKPDLSVQLDSQDSNKLFEALMFKVLDSEAKVIYEGELQSCNKVALDELPSGVSNDYTFIVELPASKGNEYQGLSTDVKFIVNASRIYNDDNSDDPNNEYNRIGGTDRIDTAIKISQEGWSNGALAVILSRDDDFPDALAGVPLSRKLDAPILLTNKDVLSSKIGDEITRLKAKTVYILGGPGAVSKGIQDNLVSKGLEVIRIGGIDRFETAALIAKRLPAQGKAVLTYGYDFPDTLAISPWAASNSVPILLTQRDYLPIATLASFKELNVKETIIVGGSGVVSENVASSLPGMVRYAGANRYQTNIEILEHLAGNNLSLGLATGEDFPDALVGAGLAAKSNSFIFLVDETLSEPKVGEFLAKHKGSIRFPYVFGGNGAVSEQVLEKIRSLKE